MLELSARPPPPLTTVFVRAHQRDSQVVFCWWLVCCVTLDFNPIELGFNALKSWLKRRRAGESSDPVLLCIRGLQHYSTTPKAAKWFRKRAYMVQEPSAVSVEGEDEELTTMMAAAAFTVVVAVATQRKASFDQT
jgi:hypothetical protein